MIKKSEFKPAWWLPGGHLQTIWSSFALRKKKLHVPLSRERIELPDGDFLDLDWTPHKQGPLVLILHGLNGNNRVHYVKNTLYAIHHASWQGVLVNFRGCSGEVNRLPRSYHAGDTADVDVIVKNLQHRFPERKIAIVGFSLGGNVLLKWLGETHTNNSIHAAVAVSVPFNLQVAAHHVTQGVSRFYQWYLLRKLRRATVRKVKTGHLPFTARQLKKYKTFLEFDDKVTANLHGFTSAEEYYHLSSCRRYLKTINVPTLVLHALNDPLMTPAVVPQEEELSEQVLLELSASGGHVGFISGNVPGKANYWFTQRTITFLQPYLESK